MYSFAAKKINLAEFYFTESISGMALFYSAECHSTSAVAKGITQLYSQTGMYAVYSFNQTKGRGQGNNEWLSEPGKNLAMTIVKQVAENYDLIALNKAIALGVAMALDELSGAAAKIKWPNDILIDNRKICGMLMESVNKGNEKYFFAGVGINVNQTNWSSAITATSLATILRTQLNIHDVLRQIINSITHYINKVDKSDIAEISDLFQINLWNLNQRILLEHEGGELIFGTINGVDELGRLMFTDSSGKNRVAHHGEVRISKKNIEIR